MRVLAPGLWPLLYVACVAGCSKAPLAQPRADAAADLGSDAWVFDPDAFHLVLPEAGSDRLAGPDTDPLLCLRTLSAQDNPGFPLDWASARNASAWCAFGPSQEWVSVENDSGYNQIVLESWIGGEMAISYQTAYLYDSKTGQFVQELYEGWETNGVTCLARSPSAPTAALLRSVFYRPGGVALGTLCGPKADGGPAPICAEVTSDDAGPVAACPCVRIGGGPAPGPDGISCTTAGQICSYAPHGCGIVSCSCEASDAGLRWTCFELLC